MFFLSVRHFFYRHGVARQSIARTKSRSPIVTNLSGHLKTGQRGWDGTVLFYPFRVGLGQPVFVLQLRGLHFKMWP